MIFLLFLFLFRLTGAFSSCKATLPCAFFLHPVYDKICEFMILQSPFGGYEHVGRRLAGKAFHDDVGTQAFEIVYHNIGIFVGSEQAEWVRVELPW